MRYPADAPSTRLTGAASRSRAGVEVPSGKSGAFPVLRESLEPFQRLRNSFRTFFALFVLTPVLVVSVVCSLSLVRAVALCSVALVL